MDHLMADIVDRLETQKKNGGVSLLGMPAGTYLEVLTVHSRYRIIMIDECEVLIQGGKHFPLWSKAMLCGSTWGTWMLKSHYIGLGMHMEIGGGKGCRTSAVESITVSDLDGSNAYTISLVTSESACAMT